VKKALVPQHISLCLQASLTVVLPPSHLCMNVMVPVWGTLLHEFCATSCPCILSHDTHHIDFVPVVNSCMGLQLPSIPTETRISVSTSMVEYMKTELQYRCMIALYTPTSSTYSENPTSSYDCNGTPAQQWIITSANTIIKLRLVPYCLDTGSSECLLRPMLFTADSALI
jgi:hypothetical protein